MSYEKKYLPLDSDIKEEWDEREDRIASEFNNIADYPIEVGDNFTKWNSGKIEINDTAMGNYSFASKYGEELYTTEDILYEYPVGVVSINNVTLTPEFTGAEGVYGSYPNLTSYSQYSMRYIFNAPLMVEGIRSLKVHIRILGRWK